jgi:hypothetical protein
MTTRQANDFIKAAEAIGKYVYAEGCFGAWVRVVRARTVFGQLQVKVLSTGKWKPLRDSKLEAR